MLLALLHCYVWVLYMEGTGSFKCFWTNSRHPQTIAVCFTLLFLWRTSMPPQQWHAPPQDPQQPPWTRGSAGAGAAQPNTSPDTYRSLDWIRGWDGLRMVSHGLMLDIDLLMDLDLRKVFPKLFQGYPILKWRVIKEKFFVGCFFGWDHQLLLFKPHILPHSPPVPLFTKLRACWNGWSLY